MFSYFPPHFEFTKRFLLSHLGIPYMVKQYISGRVYYRILKFWFNAAFVLKRNWFFIFWEAVMTSSGLLLYDFLINAIELGSCSIVETLEQIEYFWSKFFSLSLRNLLEKPVLEKEPGTYSCSRHTSWMMCRNDHIKYI